MQISLYDMCKYMFTDPSEVCLDQDRAHPKLIISTDVTAPPTQTDGSNVLTFLEDLAPLSMSLACGDRAMIAITGRHRCMGTPQGITEDCWLVRRDGCVVWSSLMVRIQHGMQRCPICCLLYHIFIGLVFYVHNSPQGW